MYFASKSECTESNGAEQYGGGIQRDLERSASLRRRELEERRGGQVERGRVERERERERVGERIEAGRKKGERVGVRERI
jgi:hypothetical protein